MTQPSVHELYHRLETVGKGSYGSVHKGIHRATGNVVALKIIDLDADDGDDVDSIQREVALLTQLRDGPNITKYYGCYLDGPRVWIVMEFAQGGSVYSLMQSSPNNCLEEKYVVVIVREVLIGLNYLHKSNVIHRDIKSANVLVTASGKVMICDFGVSALLATTNIAQPVPAYDTKADIWSLGIMIYEMIKGSPPHFRVAHLKVIQMIPKVKPPRLAENEGSKDLRDFIPFTLTESPSDRLTAEDLLKAKWIKNAARTPITLLKDLLLRYDAWVKAGSKPSDLSEPLPWEKEGNHNSGKSELDENPWEFDTVRGWTFNGPDSGSQVISNEDQAFATVKPQPSKLPTSLRHLFDGDATGPPDPFRIPGFNAASKDTVSGIPGLPLPQPSPVAPLSVPRDRAARRALRVENSFEDGPNLSTATFAFPPRTVSRGTKAKLVTGFPSSEDQSNSSSSPSSSYSGHSDRPLTAPSTSSSEMMVNNAQAPTSVTPRRRDMRLEPGDPDLEILPQRSSYETNRLTTRKDDGLSAVVITRPSPASRNRSRSSTQGPPLRPAFPTLHPGLALVFHQRGPVHQTNKLPFITLRTPSMPEFRRGRSRSATPADDLPHDPNAGLFPGGLKPQRRPSLHRLASLAVMETTPATSPSKPYSKRSRRSSGIPGLKDVLKAPALTSEYQLGMSDLLPPSPTTLHTNLKPFTPAPSHLNSSFVPSGGTHSPIANASPSPFATLEKSNDVPSPDLRTTFSTSTPGSLFPVAHRRDASLPSTRLHSFPQTRKLDFSALMSSHEDTHAELERIVDDLVQWLSIGELGLTRLLEKPSEDRIEEETEDVENGADTGELQNVGGNGNALALAAR
ncbi:hypothetical protein B0F90DRAFT_1815350 [Multifurca ochricompacta]|uniref:non-specific serine/threonine protein kinase n=1 Tax=Multifurca ochricompacta TaxID=376703 RepID=A0AAD4M9I9_9AGAM|nr:hypothetical protein B0F90DRAFT_1815350 [Multifurca ochricompacta]